MLQLLLAGFLLFFLAMTVTPWLFLPMVLCVAAFVWVFARAALTGR